MTVSIEIEEKDKDKLQNIINAVIESYYQGHGGIYINFEETNMNFDDVLKSMGCE